MAARCFIVTNDQVCFLQNRSLKTLKSNRQIERDNVTRDAVNDTAGVFISVLSAPEAGNSGLAVYCRFQILLTFRKKLIDKTVKRHYNTNEV